MGTGIFTAFCRIGFATLCGVVFVFFASPATGIQGTPTLGLPELIIPSDNPQSTAKIQLGKDLFNDKRFSADGTVSCATCHDQQRAFCDGRPVAQGINKLRGARNAPTIVNAAFFAAQFWDGRRGSLEDQARDPFVNAVEHGLINHELILKVVRDDPRYTAAFKTVFDVPSTAVTMDHVAKAIASFERTLIAGDSPFDRYQYGGDQKALSASAIRGLGLFQGRARCAGCHRVDPQNALFADGEFHRLGVGHQRVEKHLGELATQFAKAQERDVGKALLDRPELSELGRFLVTLNPDDIERFKTPSLRNVAVTAPYMHDGSIDTLEAAVDMEIYYRGLEANRPLILTPREKADLVEFLRSLTSPQFTEAGLSHSASNGN